VPPRDPAGYGGSCYPNNAAVAATALRDAGAARVASSMSCHGNGTRALFYDRADVLRLGAVDGAG
jgi:acetoin utilization deacetylase AcuC-like enzyme